MVTVSGKHLFTLSAVIVALLSISGCNSLNPVVLQGGPRGLADARVEASQTLDETHRKYAQDDMSLLPRQVYNADGKKLPYSKQPNPYMTDTTAIPADARSKFVVASGLLRAGNLKGARTQFKKLTETHPTLSGPWLELGAIAEKREKYDEAVNCYEKAISVNESNVNAYVALGLMQRKQGRFIDAQNTYIRALNVWKDFPEAHLDLAILYDLYLNKPEEAQKHYEAYYFLNNKQDEKVRKWLVEVQRRTGIERSFIDTPPAMVARKPADNANESTVATTTGSSR